MVKKNCYTGPILATGIKSRKKEHLIEGFVTIYDTLKHVGINSILHRIDNEYSTELFNEIEVKGLKYQIAPPGNHRILPTERAIHIFNNNQFEPSILSGCDQGFPTNQ